MRIFGIPAQKQARKIWGSVNGERFWYQLHGYDVEPQDTQTSMIGHSRVLDPVLRHPDKARLITRKLAMKAASRLRNKGYFARTIYTSIRTTCGLKWGNTLNISATQDPFILLHHIDFLWGDIMRTINTQSTKQIMIKKVSVIYHNLIAHGMITDDLFLSQNEAAQKTDKIKSLSAALDDLRKKYQKDVVSVGLCPNTSSGYVGTKIAFSRVPDIEEFWS